MNTIDTLTSKVIKTTCPLCGKHQYIKVNKDDYDKYNNGMLIQRAFPYLNSNQREALITGVCDSCWNKMKIDE